MAQRFCSVCGEPLKQWQRKYCSKQHEADARRGKPRPDMIGKTPWNKGVTSEDSQAIARIAEGKKKNVVDRDELYNLFVEQNLPLSVIGKRFGVSKHVIKRLTEEFGMIRKRETLTPAELERLYVDGYTYEEIGSAFNCSHAYVRKLAVQYGIESRKQRNEAGITMPPRETLHRLYWDDWLSYERIAAIFDVDFSTIPYWMKKLNIPRRQVWETRRGQKWEEPNKDTICHLYEAEGLGTQSIGEIFGVSKSFVAQILIECGVQIRQSGYPNNQRYIAEDGHKVRSSLELRVDNWLREHNLPHEYEPQINDTNYKADFLVNGTFIEIWGIRGNKHYDEKRQKKLSAYAKNKLPLISLYQSDFPHLNALYPLLNQLSN